MIILCLKLGPASRRGYLPDWKDSTSPSSFSWWTTGCSSIFGFWHWRSAFDKQMICLCHQWSCLQFHWICHNILCLQTFPWSTKDKPMLHFCHHFQPFMQLQIILWELSLSWIAQKASYVSSVKQRLLCILPVARMPQ